MIKVISTVPHKSVVKEIVCGHCGATLEYTPNDVVEKSWKDYSGDSNVTKFIVCPNCSKKAVISAVISVY